MAVAAGGWYAAKPGFRETVGFKSQYPIPAISTIRPIAMTRAGASAISTLGTDRPDRAIKALHNAATAWTALLCRFSRSKGSMRTGPYGGSGRIGPLGSPVSVGIAVRRRRVADVHPLP